MKRKVQAGLIASLLVAPGIVAQAATSDTAMPVVAVPYNTVASLTQYEQLVATFAPANEQISASELTLLNARYTNLTAAEEALLGQGMYELIDEKLQYIAGIHSFKTQASNLATRIASLSLTSGTLIKDTEKAQTDYEDDLLDAVIDLEGTLASAAEGVEGAATLLASLQYYGGNGPVDFLYEVIGEANINTLESRVQAIVEPKEFIDTYMVSLVAAMDTAVMPSTYEAALEQAQAEYNALTPGAKGIARVHVLANGKKVEDVLAAAAADFSKAAAVEAKVREILTTNFTSPTTFKTKMREVTTAYNALTDVQKSLVENWEDLAEYTQAIAIGDAIDAVKIGEVGYRDQLAAIETQYTTLGQIPTIGEKLQSYVTNYGKVTEMNAAAAKALAVEVLINAITIENAQTTIPAASAAYKALSTAEKKHVYAEDVTTLTTWEKLSSTAAVVIKNIDAVVVEKNDFVSKTNTALASWSKIAAPTGEAPTRDQQLVRNSARLLSLVPYAEAANKVNTLKMSSSTYLTDLQDAQAAIASWPTVTAGLTAADQAQLTKLKTDLQKQVTAMHDETVIAKDVEDSVAALMENPQSVDLMKLSELREKYNQLSSSAKPLVTNASDLADLEKQYRSALNVVTSIQALDFKQRDFAKRALAVKAAYDAIDPSSMKSLVTNYGALEEYVPIAQLMVDIDALRPTITDFRDKIMSARTKYNQLAGSLVVTETPTNALERLVKEYLPKLQDVELSLRNADKVSSDIEELKGMTGQAFMELLTFTKEAYAALNAAEKKLVVNAKDLTELDRDYRTALKVYNLIEKLPPTTDKNYSKRVAAAEKAYQRLADKQKGYVFNYNEKLASVLKIADLIGRIDKLKIGSRTYEADIEALKATYGTLMEAEKALIHNYDKLVQAEENMSEAEVVEKLIDEALPAAEDYLAKLTAAREAYDALDKAKRKLVSNYKDLTTRERAVKPILKLDNQIAALNPENTKKFISGYASAQKAYEKLATGEKALLANEELFVRELKPIYNVMSLIASIKPTSKTFVADTKKARELYEALSADKKAKVSNLDVLIANEMNVDGGSKIDELIADIENSDPKERIAKVKAARAAFNALDSKNRKAVTLINELKEHEKYIKPVEQAIALIEGLSNPRNKLNAQVEKVNRAMQKLNAEQTSFITNMGDYMNLSEVVKVYQLIEKLKPSDQYYLGNLQAAKAAYAKLTATEKHRVTNYAKLQESEIGVAEIQKVYNIIAGLSPEASSYEADVLTAEEAMKELPSGLRKQVTNADDLKDAQKNLKTVQSVISKIDKIDPDARSFESKVSAAKKAYDKLTNEQKKLVKNYNLLRSYEVELGLQ
ncbi:MAG: hypothetical protein ABS948_00875 [Solibacillus sp.]